MFVYSEVSSKFVNDASNKNKIKSHTWFPVCVASTAFVRTDLDIITRMASSNCITKRCFDKDISDFCAKLGV